MTTLPLYDTLLIQIKLALALLSAHYYCHPECGRLLLLPLPSPLLSSTSSSSTSSSLHQQAAKSAHWPPLFHQNQFFWRGAGNTYIIYTPGGLMALHGWIADYARVFYSSHSSACVFYSLHWWTSECLKRILTNWKYSSQWNNFKSKKIPFNAMEKIETIHLRWTFI